MFKNGFIKISLVIVFLSLVFSSKVNAEIEQFEYGTYEIEEASSTIFDPKIYSFYAALGVSIDLKNIKDDEIEPFIEKFLDDLDWTDVDKINPELRKGWKDMEFVIDDKSYIRYFSNGKIDKETELIRDGKNALWKVNDKEIMGFSEGDTVFLHLYFKHNGENYLISFDLTSKEPVMIAKLKKK